MKEADLEITEATNAPKDGTNLILAQRHYQARVLELRELIVGEEVKFKRIVSEIEEIRSGLWDNKIKAKITGVPMDEPIEDVAEDMLPAHSPAAKIDEVEHPDVTPVEESFGSDLTGVTDSDEAAKASGATKTASEDGETESQPAPESPEETVSLPVEEVGTPEDAENIPNDSDITPLPSVNVASPSVDEAASEQDPDVLDTSADLQMPERDPSEPAEEPTADEQTDGSVMDVDGTVDAESPKEEEDDHVLSPPPTTSRRRESKRKASPSANESHRDKKRAREESEPMDEDEPGPSRRRRERHHLTEEQAANKRFQNVIGMLHSQISQHRNGNIFHNPIKDSEAPDYRDIVKRPMDLKTIKTRIKDGLISTSLEFQRDVFLMFANSMMYNKPDSDIYAMAEAMMLESEGHIKTHRQTEGLIGGVSRSSRPVLKGSTN
jgi:bromodomain-containing protein 8